jgi:putative ABC transport system permease protein
LDPVPYADSDRIVVVQIHDLIQQRPASRTTFQVEEFLEYREHTTVFEEVIGGGREDVLLATDNGTEAISGGFVTANTFNFLRVPAALGRGLVADDGKPQAPSVFVMSYKMWQSRYAGDPAIIGRSFVLNGIPTTLVGIMPPRFTRFAADIWRPVKLVRGDPRLDRRLVLQGRLKQGVTLEHASRDLDQVAHGLASVYPRNYPERFAIRAVSWVDSEVGQFRLTLYTLAMAVGFLLLIACSNVANMLLATAADREKEMAVRMSVGATRWRVVRQLLIESAYLAGAGAVMGCLFALLGIKALLPFLPVGLIPPEVVIRLSTPVLAFALALTVLTTFACGLVPALQTLRRGLACQRARRNA